MISHASGLGDLPRPSTAWPWFDPGRSGPWAQGDLPPLGDFQTSPIWTMRPGSFFGGNLDLRVRFCASRGTARFFCMMRRWWACGKLKYWCHAARPAAIPSRKLVVSKIVTKQHIAAHAFGCSVAYRLKHAWSWKVALAQHPEVVSCSGNTKWQEKQKRNGRCWERWDSRVVMGVKDWNLKDLKDNQCSVEPVVDFNNCMCSKFARIRKPVCNQCALAIYFFMITWSLEYLNWSYSWLPRGVDDPLVATCIAPLG